ncbi:UNVERIFIED_CONTAM: hypothetical protein Sindi_2256100 [Sesamum indicum]
MIPASSVRSRDRPLHEEGPVETSRKRRSSGKSPLLPSRVVRSRSGEEELQSEATRLEEEINMDVLRGVTECWRTARLDLRSPDHPVARLEGDKWIPDWQISPQSSIFKTRSGQDSWELYDASCLPRDQAALLQISFTRMEEYCAHSLVQEEEWLRQRSSMEARIKELEDQMASEVSKATATGKEIGFEAGHATGKIAGAIEGREAYLNSEEFANRVREIRLNGARDFLKAPTFDSAVEIKAADYLMQGFNRCKSQVTLLNGFAPDFDVSRLDPGLDANLQPFPDEDTPTADDDEFAVLLEEIENA